MPLPTYRVHLLTEDGDSAAERGEICVGGVGVARGYLNAPEATAAKFITHPRLGRLYKTGDLGERIPFR